MSVIRRFLARATGNAVLGLRPRLPSRFEGTAGPSQSLVEQPSETVTPRLQTRAFGQTGNDPMSTGPQTPASGPTQYKAMASLPQDTIETPTPLSPAGAARRAKRDDAAEDAKPTRRPARRDAGPRLRGKPPDPPESKRPAADAVWPRKTETPAADTAPPVAARDGPGYRFQQPPRRLKSPPEPLLDRVDSMSPLAVAPTTLWPDPPAGHPRTPAAPMPSAAPAEPDIHIHIGRIELRADPAERPKSKRPARERKIASLDDYLKGGKA